MRRVKSWLACVSLFGVLVVGPSCSDTTNVTEIPKAKGCEVEADCDKGLTCTKRENALGGLCHQDCTSSESCAIGDRCVHADEDRSGSTVCQSASESLCKFDSDCFVPLKCGPDQQCRDACKNDYDCIKPQVCVTEPHAGRDAPRYCAEPYEVTEDGLIVHAAENSGGGNGGSGGGNGGSSAGDATGGTATNGAGGTSGAGGVSGGGTAGSLTVTGGAGEGGAVDPPQPDANPCMDNSAACNPLTVVVAGAGKGRVVSNPVGINCPGICKDKFPTHKAVVLTAVPEEGSALSSWSGAPCSGGHSCAVTLSTTAPTITVTFADISGDVAWIKSFPRTEAVLDMATDGDANVIVAHYNLLTSYDRKGEQNWEHQHTFTGYMPLSVATADGDVWLASVSGHLAGSNTDCTTGSNALVALLGGANGATLWDQCVGRFAAATATSGGDLVLMAETVQGVGSSRTLTRYANPTGEALWSTPRIYNAGALIDNMTVAGLAAAADDTVALGAWGYSFPNLPGTAVAAGGLDGAVAKVSGAGALMWARSFGSPGDDEVYAVAVDQDGNLAFSGFIGGRVDNLGPKPLVAPSGQDIVVGVYSAEGDFKWARTFGQGLNETGTAIVPLPNGNWLLAGNTEESLDFGQGPLTATGKRDIYFVELSGEDGSPVKSMGFGGPENDSLGRVLLDADGNLLFFVDAEGSIDLGQGVIQSPGLHVVKRKW